MNQMILAQMMSMGEHFRFDCHSDVERECEGYSSDTESTDPELWEVGDLHNCLYSKYTLCQMVLFEGEDSNSSSPSSEGATAGAVRVLPAGPSTASFPHSKAEVDTGRHPRPVLVMQLQLQHALT